ncbi:MAG: GHKL domain-containing protein [Candidatus Cloacimonetes bacterium]|nr:GHKL domain-containing protein [Candidatus Cloacimonadota bacterium]
MKKKKRGLQKQILALYFIFTFSLVFILIFSIWQLTKFGISEFEYERISRTLTNLKALQLDYTNGLNNFTSEIATDSTLTAAVEDQDIASIHSILKSYDDRSFATYTALFDTQGNMLYGEQWELVESFLPKMLLLAKQNSAQGFSANFSNKIYYFSYAPLYSENDQKKTFLGFLLNVNQITSFDIGITQNPQIFLLPFSEPLNPEQDILLKILPDLEKKLPAVLKTKNNESVLRINGEIAIGLLINYNIFNEPASLTVYLYERAFNKFYRQSMFFFFLILSASSLVIVSFLSNWFSKKIMQPVKQISDKMQRIEKNPLGIEHIEDEYGGELSNMVSAFSSMNKSLVEYHKSLLEYKVLTDNIDIGVLWMDSKMNILICNPSAMDILEIVSPEKIIGKNLSEFIRLDEDLISKAHEDSLTLPRLEINLPGIKKFVKFVILNIKAVDDTIGLRMVATITDITREINEKKAREALEMEIIKSNKLAEIGRRVEGVVHNMNSPLNSILGYAQLAKKEYKDNDDIDKIINAAKNISHSVKTLLRKVQQDNISMMRPIDINLLIEEELELLKHNLFFKHYVVLEKNLFNDLPPVKAVYSDISQSFTNLVNNAIESMHDSKERNIWVCTYQTDDMVAIEVRDTGEGIEERYHSAIFEPYYSSKKGKEQGGFGLGLAICKNVAERYGGYITVRSERDKGSTFTIFLPYKKR